MKLKEIIGKKVEEKVLGTDFVAEDGAFNEVTFINDGKEYSFLIEQMPDGFFDTVDLLGDTSNADSKSLEIKDIISLTLNHPSTLQELGKADDLADFMLEEPLFDALNTPEVEQVGVNEASKKGYKTAGKKLSEEEIDILLDEYKTCDTKFRKMFR